jgi:MarR family transcriptional regulator, organic hydroperoxide resistance regulator
MMGWQGGRMIGRSTIDDGELWYDHWFMTPDNAVRRLETELRLRRPFASPGKEALLGILRTASVCERALTKALAPHALSSAQFNVLRILRGAEPDGLPTLAIRDRMVDPAAAITRLVDRLERAGLVERIRTIEDRRQVMCRISARGLALLEVLDPVVATVDAAIEAALDAEDLRCLNETLEKVRTNL